MHTPHAYTPVQIQFSSQSSAQGRGGFRNGRSWGVYNRKKDQLSVTHTRINLTCITKESATDRVETVSINCIVEAQTENVSFCVLYCIVSHHEKRQSAIRLQLHHRTFFRNDRKFRRRGERVSADNWKWDIATNRSIIQQVTHSDVRQASFVFKTLRYTRILFCRAAQFVNRDTCMTAALCYIMLIIRGSPTCPESTTCWRMTAVL